MGVRRGFQNGHFPPLEIGPKKEKNFLENMKSAAQFRLIDLILAMTVYSPVRHTLHKNQVYGLCVIALVSLLFTYVPLRGRTSEQTLLLLVVIA